MANAQIETLKLKIAARMQTAATRGLNKARFFLEAKAKEAISVPAPRRGKPGNYRATTRAVPGAPIRKLSGRARANLSSIMVSPTEAAIIDNAKSARGFPYPLFHEQSDPTTGHQFVEPTANKNKADLERIIRDEIRKG